MTDSVATSKCVTTTWTKAVCVSTRDVPQAGPVPALSASTLRSTQVVFQGEPSKIATSSSAARRGSTPP
jgi:hypothetical protein